MGSHGGLSVGEDGATHQCIEDYAIMRAIPNMMVVSPCDGPEMRQAVRALLDYDGPAYLRLGRLAVESVTDAIPGYTFHLGQGVTLRDGSDATVIATGMMVQMALKAAESLAAEGLSVRVLDMHTIKPLDGELVLKAALETGAIVTTEEANVGGAWARRWRSSWPSTTRCRWCATASTTCSAAPARRRLSWRPTASPRRASRKRCAMR